MKINNKNKILFLGVFTVFYLAYYFAVSKTMDSYNENKEKKKRVDNSLGGLSVQQMLLKEKQADELIRQYKITGTKKENFQNFLLNEIDRLCRETKINIHDFKEPAETKESKNSFYYILTVEGKFNNTLKFINKLENNHNVGKIKSIAFSKLTDYNTKSEKLYTEIALLN
ncbi:hypothetical protein NAT51_15370 [Flavobacterium amniphilum]|uniref:hypothetical protein n=1 Tax=Flavobacterium amniphilum TaxID=1834035 RepID=UPI00202A9455|nr:hypothetical protein [Flavobacterium amniphilum]MCL9806915.1 hypothetical protein [Flavobacterium amniphilum]